jgi:hypothetical protein
MTPIWPTSLANRINVLPPTLYPYLFIEIGYVLMSPLNIHPEEDQPATKKKTNKLLKALLGISALIAVPVIGTTLAASITINSGTSNQIQFGQGKVQATACDSEVTVSSTTTFDNDSTYASSSFKVLTVTASGIADACSGETITMRLYGNSSDTPLTVASGSATTTALIADVSLTSTTWTATKQASADYSVAMTYGASGASYITFTLVTTVAATGVERVTIETT